VDASKQEGSEVQALALLHLGVAYHEAASQMRLLSRKMKVRYNEEALVVLEMAAQLQPSNFFCVFNLARIQVNPLLSPESSEQIISGKSAGNVEFVLDSYHVMVSSDFRIITHSPRHQEAFWNLAGQILFAARTTNRGG
jgi:hypothetical protein